LRHGVLVVIIAIANLLREIIVVRDKNLLTLPGWFARDDIDDIIFNMCDSFHKQRVTCLGPCALCFICVLCYASVSVYLVLRVQFLGDRLQNGSPYAIGPLSVCLVCLSVTLVYCGQTLNGSRCHLTRRYADSPRPRPHCVRWEPSSLHGKGHSNPPLFGPCLLWPNGRSSQQLLSSCSIK